MVYLLLFVLASQSCGQKHLNQLIPSMIVVYGLLFRMSFGSYRVLFPWNVETSSIFYLYSNWLFDFFNQIAKLTDCRS